MPTNGEMRSRTNRNAVTLAFIGSTLVLLALVWGVSAAATAAAGVAIGPSYTESALPGQDIVYQQSKHPLAYFKFGVNVLNVAFFQFGFLG